MERTPPLIVTSQNLIGADWWVVLIVCGQAAFMAMPIRSGLDC